MNISKFQIESTLNNVGNYREKEGCMNTHISQFFKSDLDNLYSNESSLCRIKYKNDKGQNGVGTGFFCKINEEKIPFKKALFTNSHVLNENNIENSIELNKEIEFVYLNENKKIKMTKNRKIFINKDLDYTCIEIFEEDEIKQYFEIDESYFHNRNIIKNKEIIILQYSNEGKLKYTSGKILYIINNDIYHSSVIYYGSSGSPLIKRYDSKLILGIQCSDIKKNNNNILFNLAIPFDVILKDIKRKLIRIKIINSNYTIINLIYYKNEKENDLDNIFGSKFVENNKDNITLIINDNDEEIPLISKYNLNKGKNDIQMVIKNKLTNLENMFYGCKSLQNIDELKYLDTENVNNFSCMFSWCSSLSNISALENWKVSNVNNFSYMFSECSSLSDIKPLEFWNVSNGSNFSYMFSWCSSLSEIKSLEYWDIKHGKNLSYMFFECKSLWDIEPLENWKVSNINNFSYMFSGCSSLSDILPFENWNVSNGKDFKGMFSGCSSLSDIEPLEYWNVSNGKNFSYMFCGCKSLLDLEPLKYWNVSNGNNFSYMFCGCKSLLDIKVLQKWNISKKYKKTMFQ